MATTFQPRDFYDTLKAFDFGMHSGQPPALLPKNQLHFALNTTVRGAYATHRTAYRKMSQVWTSTDSETAFKKGKFQGAAYYRPDGVGGESLFAAVDGRLYQFEIGQETDTMGIATATERTIPGDPNPASKPQAWMWQSEKWLIWMDGESVPVFVDETTARRSNWNARYVGSLVVELVINGGGSYTATLDGPYPGSDLAGTLIYIGFSNFVFEVAAGMNGQSVITITPTSYTAGEEITFAVGTKLYFLDANNELPPGRMGCYGLGRNWISLPDGKQFIASDIVNGSSGTVENQYRDAVLKVSENDYLAGGGNFTVPGNIGDIQAMLFTASLDESLGQGPLQIFTPTTVFSCKTPVERLDWQDVTNPILTQSLIANGAMSQWSTVMANGDTLFRSVDGIRSLILGRREFATWGNVPISEEMQRIIPFDDQRLLQYSSAVIFDNRLLMTAVPTTSLQGVYHKGLVALNFDPVSSLRGKTPSVYDGLWTGLNVLQLVTGLFGNMQRAFAFCLNVETSEIELWELLADDGTYEDQVGGTGTSIYWKLESPAILNSEPRTFKRLVNGEIYVSDMKGLVNFKVSYRPDQSQCWQVWHSWEECADMDGDGVTAQFRPRMGLGEPSPTVCDPSTKRPFREGYEFQIKIEILGHCRVTGGRFKAIALPEPEFSLQCFTICESDITDVSVDEL